MPTIRAPADSESQPTLQLFHRSEIGRTALRFGLGDRVECRFDDSTAWRPGNIFRLFYHEARFGKDMCVAYQILLDDPDSYPGEFIFSPRVGGLSEAHSGAADFR